MKAQPGEPVIEIPLGDLWREHGLNVRGVNSNDPKVHELAESIKAHGILEPVLVTKGKDGHKGSYRLVCGFRRAAAAGLANLATVPAIVRELDDEAIRQVQLVENVQREDLNPIDEARALRELLAKGDLTQAELGKQIGKSQAYVANRIRLLNLPESGQELVAAGKVSTHVVAEILKLPEAAATERKRLVRQVSDQLAKNGEVSPREFRWTVQAAQRSFQERKEREEKVAKAKFPNCPAEGCGKKGRPPRYYGESGFSCSAGHRWDAKSGKLAPKDPERPRSVYTPPPEPTLPEVDGDVPTALVPMQLGNVLVEAIRDFHGIQLTWHQGTRAELRLDVELPGPKGAKVPEFEFESGHKFVTLSSAEWQSDDKRRKQAAAERADLEAWLATFGRQKTAAKKGGRK